MHNSKLKLVLRPDFSLVAKLVCWFELACLLPWWSGTPLFLLTVFCVGLAITSSTGGFLRTVRRNLILIVSCLLIGALSAGGRVLPTVDWVNFDGFLFALEQVARLLTLLSVLKWATASVSAEALLNLSLTIPSAKFRPFVRLLMLTLLYVDQLTVDDCRNWLTHGRAHWPDVALKTSANNPAHGFRRTDIILLLLLPLMMVGGISS